MQSALNHFIPFYFAENQSLCILVIVGLSIALQKKLPVLLNVIGILGFIYTIAASILNTSWLQLLIWLGEGAVVSWIIDRLNLLASESSYQYVVGDKIQAGMILSFGSILAMQKYIDPDLPRYTTETRRSRISQRQAEAVKRWCKNTGENVAIVEMLPFAPFIAFGVVYEIIRYIIYFT